MISLVSIGQIGRYCVVVPQGLDQILRLFLPNLLYPKVVYYWGETDWPPLVCPECWRTFTFVIILVVQTLLRQLLGNDSGMCGFINALDAASIDKHFVVNFFLELVMFNHVVGEVGQFHPEELWSG